MVTDGLIGLPEKSQAQERAKHARASNVPGEIGLPDANEMGGSSSIVPPNFLAWLREQAKSGGAIGELAKAARLDPSFPKKGSADDVRARFGRFGADGDAYAALEDAERAYDRLK